MIINDAPANVATLSNVENQDQFRIKNSPKAFSILSSGLYSNKIRAIIRELSCNAADSHAEAGQSCSYTVHLPTALEPWFSIRDYGTGLTHDQVINIYTTYFESTKTGSNDFIGALGLGSKSPFSYTDNFTVIAIRDGIRGIYTAYISDQGVPSIAQMFTEETDDPAGVEVKFAVESGDFGSFKTEAQHVYRTFTMRPDITGNHDFVFLDYDYDEKDIIPGVHLYNNPGWSKTSVAIMGNVAYPIDKQVMAQSLPSELAYLFDKCDLMLEFNIGELDVQASREGLSYIPLTVKSITNKLQQLHDHIYAEIEREAQSITSDWERAIYLLGKSSSSLWSTVVNDYIRQNYQDHAIYSTNRNAGSHYGGSPFFLIKPQLLDELCGRYHVSFNAFYVDKTWRSGIARAHDFRGNEKITVHDRVQIVVNDTNRGAMSRAKEYVKGKMMQDQLSPNVCFVLSKVNKDTDADFAGFLRDLGDPDSSRIILASDFKTPPKRSKAKSSTDLSQNRVMIAPPEFDTWDTQVLLSDCSDTDTYYYMPLSGHEILSKIKDIRKAYHMISYFENKIVTIYGVRKNAIKAVESLSNWIMVDDYLDDKLNNLSSDQLTEIVQNKLDMMRIDKYYSGQVVDEICQRVAVDNPWRLAYQMVNKPISEWYRHLSYIVIEDMLELYGDDSAIKHIESEIERYKGYVDQVNSRYPLLDMLTPYVARDCKSDAIVGYLNAIDLAMV